MKVTLSISMTKGSRLWVQKPIIMD